MIKNPDGTVTLTADEYEEILDKQDWLDCLEAAGVDNWEGYDEACSMFHENNND